LPTGEIAKLNFAISNYIFKHDKTSGLASGLAIDIAIFNKIKLLAGGKIHQGS